MTEPIRTIADLDPALLEYLNRAPFITANPGDTVIFCIDGAWDMEQIDSLGSYLEDWNPQVKWRAVHAPGFAGVIHIPAGQDTAPMEPTTPL